MIHQRLNFIIYILICVTVIDLSGSIAAEVSKEYAVKAAFIYNFTKFVDWPSTAFSSPDAPFVFGVFGNNPFEDSLQFLKDKTVKGHPIEIRYVNDLSDAVKSHLLFVCASEKDRLREICRFINAPVLTIGDVEGFNEAGGVINLITVNKKIRFIINQEAAMRAGLYISSHLLKLALPLRK